MHDSQSVNTRSDIIIRHIVNSPRGCAKIPFAFKAGFRRRVWLDFMVLLTKHFASISGKQEQASPLSCLQRRRFTMQNLRVHFDT